MSKRKKQGCYYDQLLVVAYFSTLMLKLSLIFALFLPMEYSFHRHQNTLRQLTHPHQTVKQDI